LNERKEVEHGTGHHWRYIVKKLRTFPGVKTAQGRLLPSVSLLPYNPAAVEMAPCLGRPAPKLPGNFMKPEEEQNIYAMFSELLEEKANASLIIPEG
jgi:hypothetical protein